MESKECPICNTSVPRLSEQVYIDEVEVTRDYLVRHNVQANPGLGLCPGSNFVLSDV